MKAHIGVDADSGLMHTVRSTAGHVADVTEGNALLHGEETVVYADSAYQGADKRLDARRNAQRAIAGGHACGQAQKARQSKQSHRRTHQQN